MSELKNGLTYADAGVDIDAGNLMVEKIKPLVRSTRRPGADGEIGGFGGLFDLKAAGFTDPVLVAANDGVGTKLKIAIEARKHDTIGIDLVAMCVNDLVVQGAEPLFFLDYFATGKLDLDQGAAIVGGIAEGCRQAGCALIGGETAEMPGMYHGDDYDLAGFAVGAAERGQLLPTDDIVEGDVMLGLTSSGVHSNGFSLVRRIVRMSGLAWSDDAPFAAGQTLAEALLEPTRIYVKALLKAIRGTHGIKALAHITGGGFPDNIPRVLSKDFSAELDLDAIDVPPVFSWLARTGGVAPEEMMRTFNCGIGMVLVVASGQAAQIAAVLQQEGETVAPIGRIVQGATRAWSIAGARTVIRKRVVILISGRGSNMARLIEAAHDRDFPAEIVGVISDVPDAPGLHHAENLGIPARPLPREDHASKQAHDDAIHAELLALDAELVCLAGYMRLLSAEFVERWQGQMINVHPALLPSFRGLDTHRKALDSGVLVHGCTVHFVTAAMDSGPIIAQAAVPVIPGDTAHQLAARVLKAEHELYPMALRLVAEGRARMVGGRTEFGDLHLDCRASRARLFSPATSEGAADFEALARVTP